MVAGVIRDHFDKVFVINMKRSIKRRAMFLSQASIVGLSDTEIIRGVDGRNLDLGVMRSRGILRRDARLKRDLTAGEVGCYLSHVYAWKSVLEREVKTALICEDDIVWMPDANVIVDRFMAEVPDDWDIIHFHSYVKIGSHLQNDPWRYRIGEHVWQGYNEGGGSVCYAITSRGAGFLLDIAFPICSAVDGRTNWLTGWWKACEGYRGYICWPFPCGIGNVSSEIDSISPRAGNQ
jgi:glycosyl transferase family 25